MLPRKEGTGSRGGVKSRGKGKTTIKNKDIDQKNGTVSVSTESRKGRRVKSIVTEYKGAMTRSRAKKLEQEKEEQEQQQEQEQDKEKFKNQTSKKVGSNDSATVSTATRRKATEQGAVKEVTGKISVKKKKTHHEVPAITTPKEGTEVNDVEVNDGEVEVDDFLEVVARGCGSRRTSRFVPPFPFPQPETGPYDYYYCAWRVKSTK
jgi:hypothetical protein